MVGVLHGWGLDGLAESARLLTSELVTNAVLHARTSITVRVARDESRRLVRVSVQDGSARSPRERNYSDLSTTGRGLHMVRGGSRDFGDRPAGVREVGVVRAAVRRGPGRARRRGAGVTAVDDELVEVRLLGFPLDVYERAQEHGDGLVRELMLIAQSSPQEHEVPVRLTAIVTELSSRFAGFGDDTDAVRDAAIDRGERSIDLEYLLPRAAGAASVHLGDILDEADEYCRQGEHLLSLTTPPEAWPSGAGSSARSCGRSTAMRRRPGRTHLASTLGYGMTSRSSAP